MLVKMLTSYSGNNGSCAPGDCIEMPSAEANRYLAKELAVKPDKVDVDRHKEKLAVLEKENAEEKARYAAYEEAEKKRLAELEKEEAAARKKMDKEALAALEKQEAEIAESKAIRDNEAAAKAEAKAVADKAPA